MGRNYKQITLAERCQITQLLAAGSKVREIAAALDRAPSTVARELKRNGSRTKAYDPSYAQQQARARSWNGGLSRCLAFHRGTSLPQIANPTTGRSSHSNFQHPAK